MYIISAATNLPIHTSHFFLKVSLSLPPHKFYSFHSHDNTTILRERYDDNTAYYLHILRSLPPNEILFVLFLFVKCKSLFFHLLHIRCRLVHPYFPGNWVLYKLPVESWLHNTKDILNRHLPHICTPTHYNLTIQQSHALWTFKQHKLTITIKPPD